MSDTDLLTILETTNPHDEKLLQEKLSEYNQRYSPADEHRSLNLLAKRPDGSLAGGLVASTFWSWLHVDILWVDDRSRRQGLGSRLLKAAEAEAVLRGCRWSHLETHTFQAPAFYRMHGYSVYAELPDFPPGSTKYFLKKDLLAPDS